MSIDEKEEALNEVVEKIQLLYKIELSDRERRLIRTAFSLGCLWEIEDLQKKIIPFVGGKRK